MPTSKSLKTKEDVAMEIFKMTIDRLPQDSLTKEMMVETYNYIYDNIHTSHEPVQIIDDIQA